MSNDVVVLGWGDSSMTGLEGGFSLPSGAVVWRWAWAAAGLAIGSVAVAASLFVASPEAWERLRSEPLASLGSVAVGFSAAGVVALPRQRRIGLLALVVGVTSGLSLLGWEYGRYALLVQGGDLPFGRAAAVVGWALWAPGFGLTLGILPLVFPDGRLPSPRWRLLVAITAIAATIATLGAGATAAVASEQDLFSNETPTGTAGDLAAVVDVMRLVLLLCGLAAVTSLVIRYRHAVGLARRQLLWLVAGFGGLVLLLVASSLVEVAWLPLEIGGILCFPASLAIAVRRHGLWDIERLVSRGAVYLAMSGLVGLGYLVVIAAAATVFDDRSSVGATVIVAIAIAAVFQPAREAIQARVDQAIYGTRRDPSATMDLLHHRLNASGGRGDMLDTVTASLREALRLGYVDIEPVGGESLEGSLAPRSAHRFPLHVEGELVGSLVVAAAPGDHIGEREQSTLRVAAGQVALLVFAGRLLEDARRSRERVVVAREEERRRLRRDLHDGLGPALAGLGLQAAAAATLSATDPDRTAALLRRIADEAADITLDVRRLVDDLRPPALDDLGLVEAVRRYASGLTAGRGSCTVTVESAGCVDGVPAAVEVAAYRIATEAILNVHRHADAAHCQVRLAFDDGLDLVVADDGRGIAPDASAGVGLVSMAERADELGGAVEVASGPEGTRIHARIPVL